MNSVGPRRTSEAALRQSRRRNVQRAEGITVLNQSSRAVQAAEGRIETILADT